MFTEPAAPSSLYLRMGGGWGGGGGIIILRLRSAQQLAEVSSKSGITAGLERCGGGYLASAALPSLFAFVLCHGPADPELAGGRRTADVSGRAGPDSTGPTRFIPHLRFHR